MSNTTGHSSAASVPAYLAVISGDPPKGLRLTVGEFVAGRSPTAAIRLNNMQVSRAHCRFQWSGERCQVEDLGSARGTKVNGKPINGPTPLRPKDRVDVGGVVIEFGLGEPPADSSQDYASEAGHVLTLLRGQPVDRIPTNEPLVIGRDSSAEVVLNDPGVSRKHASLQPLPEGGCVVQDEHSTGGTFVNGHRFATHKLVVGDRLQIGPFSFLYDGQSLVRSSAARGSTVEARHVTRRVPARVLLDDVSVTLPSSQFIGILGPSGAGKSTLLKMLAGLDAPSAGEVLIDGENIYARNEPVAFGYVPQDDIVHKELTARQSLLFSARLRLPKVTPQHEIERLVEQTLEQLELEKYQDTPIHRLSGGQRKRVSVGVELLARPAILFLDEPSSGLDPATEFQLMELLRDLASSGCTIVCTTHVIENAFLMDQLVILTWGCLAFQGSAQEVRDYFAVSKLIAVYERLREAQPTEWKLRFEAHRQTLAESSDHFTPKPPSPAVARQAKAPARRMALPILLQRQSAILAADWRNLLLLLGEPVLVALLVAWVARTSELALFFAYISTLWFGCSNAAQEIVKELPIYLRERLVGLGRHEYLCSKFLMQISLTGIQALLMYGTLKACMPALDGHVGMQLTGLLAIASAAVGIGCAISAFSRNIMQAVLVVPLVLIPQILFSGATVLPQDMKPSVLSIARFVPTFAAQRFMDSSYFWGQKVGDVTSRVEEDGKPGPHTFTLTSLNEDFVPRAPKTGVEESEAAYAERTKDRISRSEVYGWKNFGDLFSKREGHEPERALKRLGPVLRALITSIFWAALGYAAAFGALVMHERKK